MKGAHETQQLPRLREGDVFALGIAAQVGQMRGMKLTAALLLAIPFVAFAQKPAPVFEMSIERVEPAFDKLVAPGTSVERLADGFTWSEGPTWLDGAVVFSDVPQNVAYRWKEGMTKAEVFLKPSGMTTPTEGFREQGSNGLARDAKERLVLCMHGDRRVARFGGMATCTSRTRLTGWKRGTSHRSRSNRITEYIARRRMEKCRW
jgi:gluconolactonase